MEIIKQWFDVHDSSYKGIDCKRPISAQDEHRMQWIESEFPRYIKNIQESSIASGGDGFTHETFQAWLFTTSSTVETVRFLLESGVKYVFTRKFNSDPVEAVFGRLRSMCGGNDMLDARAVTAALDYIVKEKAPSKQIQMSDTDSEQLAAAVPNLVTTDLKKLKELYAQSPSVTYSGLVYVGGYLVKLI
ncbi:hypothetical protein HPB47_015976, partial [Ixodes persulcatus]